MRSSDLRYNWRSAVFELLCALLTVLVLLLLGSEYDSRDRIRIFLSFGLFVFLLISHKSLWRRPQHISPTAVFFAMFLVFQITRMLWSFADESMWNHGMGNASAQKMQMTYAAFPLNWFGYGIVLITGWLYYNRKSALRRMMNICAWTCFVLAMNAIPACLFNKTPGYQNENGQWSFFYPAVYFSKGVSKYWISRFAFENHVGDIIAFGFFPAAVLALYAYHIFREKKRNHEILPSDRAFANTVPYIALRLTMAAAIATAVLLIFSRGTMLSFFIANAFFAVFVLIKLMKRIPWFTLILLISVSMGFVFWSGNFKKAWKEIITVSQERGDEQSSSGANVSGARIAWAMHKDHPLWGVGNEGYIDHAAYTAKRDGIFIHKNIPVVKNYAMSHFLHIWAEQGAGAFLYFLFLISYGIEMMIGLLKTKSRFKLLTGLAFFSFAIMSLGHAAIGYSMERFGVAMLVYLSMGLSLAAVREDFIHE